MPINKMNQGIVRINMLQTDKRIDQYIASSADFAKPILIHLRSLVHEACPDVKETIKWSFPHFEYNNTILCSMASFRQHCSFGFWLGSVLKDHHKILEPVGDKSSMGHLGKITSVKDLPSKKILIQYIKEAMKLNEEGIKLPKKAKPASPKEIEVPGYFMAALKKNKKAYAAFEDFRYSHKKEYVEWVTEAKTEETREKRIATAIGWISEGKSRNWKYMKVS